MSKQQTAMQKLIFFMSDGLGNQDESITNNEIWKEVFRLLETEKIQIQDAFDDGQANWDEKCQDYKNGKQYFNNSFKL